MSQPPTKLTSTDFLRRLLFAAFALLVLAAAVGYPAIKHLWRDAPGRPSDPPVTVIIERGSGLRSIAATLAANGVVAEARGFILLAKYEKTAGKLKAGEYAIRRGLPMREVLGQLVEGTTVKHRFTVIPGETAAAVADKLVTKGLDPDNEAHRLIADPAFAAELRVRADKLEGYLFPETYLYKRGDDARGMLTRMVEQFHREWDSFFTKSELTRHRIVTLASIVEKESGYLPERRKVARVFFNRLRARIPLQADPSVIYAQGKSFTGALTKAHLRRDHPYNTYTRRGLPPGPICNPSRNAMEAALHPDPGAWLYFVADGMGRHVFSEKLEQHNEAVRKYRKLQK